MVFTVSELLNEYAQHGEVFAAEKLVFTGVGDRDVYNITAPFEDEGEKVIAGRVEHRDTEFSEIVFFVEEDGVWRPRENTQTYELQDPFVTRIQGLLVFGGVEVFPHPENEKQLMWHTVFYKGKNIRSLEKFATGPVGMKDIRLFEYKDKVGVFTRPQGEKGGRGKIGFTLIDSLEDLNEEIIDAAPLIKPHFLDEEWGGVNAAYVAKDGERIFALAHIARFDQEGNRHYYPVTFEYNPEQNEIHSMKIIATRSDFPEGPAKRPDLEDVLFSGGLYFLDDEKVELYVGVSDAEAHKATIPNPFGEVPTFLE